jgi:hypothetical protein
MSVDDYVKGKTSTAAKAKGKTSTAAKAKGKMGITVSK